MSNLCKQGLKRFPRRWNSTYYHLSFPWRVKSKKGAACNVKTPGKHFVIQKEYCSLNMSCSSRHFTCQAHFNASSISLKDRHTAVLTMDSEIGSEGSYGEEKIEPYFRDTDIDNFEGMEDADEVGNNLSNSKVKKACSNHNGGETNEEIVRRSKVKVISVLPERSKFDEGKQLSHWGLAKVRSMMEGYLFLGMQNEALKVMNFYARKGHNFCINDYNKLLRNAVAVQDNLAVKVILSGVHSQGLKYDIQTYCTLLQHAEISHDKKRVQDLVDEMIAGGYNVNDIYTKCSMSIEQVKLVTSALHRINYNCDLLAFKMPEKAVTTRLVEDIYVEKSERTMKDILRVVREATDHCYQKGHKELDIVYLKNSDLESFLKEQLDRESSYYSYIKSVETLPKVSQRLKTQKSLYAEIVYSWKTKFVAELKKIIELKGQNSKKLDPYLKTVVLPYLCLLEPEQYADIVLNESIPCLATQQAGMSTVRLCRTIGDMIYNVFNLKYKQLQGCDEVVRDIYNDYGKYVVRSSHMSSSLPREMWKFCAKERQIHNSDHESATPWTLQVKLMVSAALLDILIKVAVLDEKGKVGEDKEVPAIQHGSQFSKGRSLGIVKLHPYMCRIFKSQTAERGEIAIESFKMPMVVPPKPWTSINDGGFLLQTSPFVRSILDEYNHKDLRLSSENGKLNAIFDALNYLGSCPWKINERILEIMLAIFNDKGDPDLDITGPVFSFFPKLQGKILTSKEESAEAVKERKKLKKEHHEHFALRMGQLYLLSIASHLRNRLFWLPYNLDFRGRVYTIPPYCTHIGNDVNRGLMLFGKGKCLGENGLDWLKIHLVNLHGAKKKGSLQERLDYANDMLLEIFDSADNPLTGNQWWRGADEPWQTLATCMEIVKAMRSSDPAKFMSYLPVHQDGSCNGLQHYAALGRDQYGAEKVNVCPSEKPQDVYSEVAFLVEKQRALDAANGHEMAIFLEGKVTRKVVKQTVMTIVYGVTHIGARLQIERQLKELGDFDRILLFKSSDYLVSKVFASIGQLFNSARKIQDWLTKSAVDICAAGQPVAWVTPLGLPIVQPYHKRAKEHFESPLQKMSTQTYFDETKKPDTRKQKGGFPPNYVHSLDSTHMLLTALHCQKNDILFASVHDSFWTHACDVSRMGQICREQFYRLHSEPLLENLQSSFQMQYGKLKARDKELTFDHLPASGSFDLKKVLESIYFFS